MRSTSQPAQYQNHVLTDDRTRIECTSTTPAIAVLKLLACLLVVCLFAWAPAQVENPGFERQIFQSGAWEKDVPYNVWIFTEASGLANGDTPWDHIGVHSGSQYAFIQSRHNIPSSMTQTVYGFVPGQTYHIEFWMVSRAETGGVPIVVRVEGTTVLGPTQPPYSPWQMYSTADFVATSYAQKVVFSTLTLSGDGAVDIDDVVIPGLPNSEPTDVKNPGFETPVLPTNSSQSNPQLNRWQFNADSGIGSGQTTFGQVANTGSQYAYLTNGPTGGEISQTVAWFVAEHSYQVKFAMAKGMGSSAPVTPVTVSIDGRPLGVAIKPTADGTWQTFTTDKFIATGGFHAIRFSLPAGAGDSADLLDDVQYLEATPNAPVVFDSGFEVPDTLDDEWLFNLQVSGGWGSDASGGVTNSDAAVSFTSRSGKQFGYFYNGGSLAETVDGLIAGHTYRIHFLYVGGAISATADSTIIATKISTPGPTWKRFISSPFTASSHSARLTFTGGTLEAAVDDVSIEDTKFAAIDDFYSVPGSSLTVSAANGLMSNDVLISGSTVVLADNPLHGAAAVNDDGSFTYTPDSGFAGFDRFTYSLISGGQQTNVATVTLQVGSSLSEVAVAPGSIAFGHTAAGTLTLSSPSVSGDLYHVSLTNPLIAIAPFSVFVPAGGSSATFPIDALSTAGSTAVVVFRGGDPLGAATLAVTPPELHIALSVSSCISTNSVTGTLFLDDAPSADAVVNLSSSDSAASVPASATIASGTNSAYFSIKTYPVNSPTSVTITAQHGGQTQTAHLTVNPILVSALSVQPSSVPGGTGSTGHITLNTTVGQNTVVGLSSGMPSVAAVPASLTVGSGTSSGTFSISSRAVNSDTPVTITATVSSQSANTTLTVLAATPNSIVFSPASVVGGNPSVGSIALNGDAGSSGTTVSLTNNGSSVVAVPASVTVPSGSTSATFPITTYGTGYVHAARITATANGVSRSAYITINPASLSSLSMPATILAGDSGSGRLLLDGQSGPAMTASLSSNNAALIVPGTASIPANSTTSSPFVVQTSLVSANRLVTVTATLGSVSKTTTITVVYSPFQITLSPATTGSGQNITGTLSLGSPAPSAGSTIRLWNNGDSFFSVPASATVPAGLSSATFTVTVYGVNWPTVGKVVASTSSLTRSATFAVNPATLQSVQLARASVVGGQSTSGRAFLTGPNGTRSLTVALSSDNPAVTVPPTATVPPDGHDTFLFTVSTSSVQTSQTATITATLNRVSKTVVLTVAPGP